MSGDRISEVSGPIFETLLEFMLLSLSLLLFDCMSVFHRCLDSSPTNCLNSRYWHLHCCFSQHDRISEVSGLISETLFKSMLCCDLFLELGIEHVVCLHFVLNLELSMLFFLTVSLNLELSMLLFAFFLKFEFEHVVLGDPRFTWCWSQANWFICIWVLEPPPMMT